MKHINPPFTAENSPTYRTAPRIRGALAILCLAFVPAALQASIPPDPTVEIRFPEGPADAGGQGVTTTNSGTLGGLATFAQPVDPIYETNLYPAFSTNRPVGTYVPSSNDFAAYFGPIQGNSLGGTHGRAIDLVPAISPGFNSIGAYPKLTVCGWVNASGGTPGNGGNRIAFALETPGGLGFDLVQRASGQLSLIVNQYNDSSPESSPGMVTFDANHGTNNWVYFAATYDPTLPSGQVKYYFGRPNKLAALDVARDYVPPAGTNIDFTGQLTLGNFGTVEGQRDAALGGNSRIFRGLIDEIRIYTNALTLDEIQQAQLNDLVTPVAPTILKQPINTFAIEGQNPSFSVEGTGSGLLTYQWKTNGVNVPGATSTSFVISDVTLAQNGTTVQVGITNSVGGLLSTLVTLSVLPANPMVVATSFSEGGASATTTNLGALSGFGRFLRNAGLPAFVTTNLPSGPFAPSAPHNQQAVLYSYPDGGNRAIDLTNNLISAAGELGSLEAVTICGWINSANHTFRTTSTGRGSGVVTATRGGTVGGFVLNYRSDDLSATYGQNGRLQFHVNEFTPDVAGHISSAGKIPLNTNLPPTNWVFFAVTYDGNSTTDNLAFYFGDANNAASLDAMMTYNKGVMPVTGQLVIGNYQTGTANPTGRGTGGANGAAFRGLIDEVKVFSKVLTLSEIQQQQTSPALPTLLLFNSVGSNLALSWETLTNAPYKLQARTNLTAGSWVDVSATETVSGNVHSVTVPKDKEAEFFHLQRQ